MSAEIPPRILRDLARQREATRAAREALVSDGEPTDTFGPGDLDELSEVTRAAVAAGVADGLARDRQATLPDSDPPPVLSVGWEGGRPHARVRSAWLALALILVAGLVLAAWLAPVR